MIRRSLGKAGLAILFIGSLAALFPLAVRLANPFATFVYNPTVDARILLLWPDRIELQPVRALANFSPRPRNAGYAFVIPPGREGWVRDQLKTYPTPTKSA